MNRITAGVVSILAAAATTIVLTSCSPEQRADEGLEARTTAEAQPSSTNPNVVMVTARDYAFEAPDEIPAGWTTFEMRVDAQEPHQVWLVRLDDGKTLNDLVAAVQAGGPPPAWAVDVGGPNAAMPGESASATLELTPGRYAMLCFIPSPDGTPHVGKGMMKEFTVVPAEGSATAAPEADIVMTLADYDFQFSQPVTAGTHTIRVENAAQQPHEFVVVQLEAGKTAADFAHWAESPQGPPPGVPVGGAAGIAPGEVNFVEMSFEPGRYGLLCFVPDASDGAPHIVHGMVKEFTVE